MIMIVSKYNKENVTCICPKCSSGYISIANLCFAKVKNYNPPYDTVELPIEEAYYCGTCGMLFMTQEQAVSISLDAKSKSGNSHFEPTAEWSDPRKGVLRYEFV